MLCADMCAENKMQPIIDANKIIPPNDYSLNEFCRRKKYIYIYGAGKYGKALKHELDFCELSVNGFLVGKENPYREIDGLTVCNLVDFADNTDDCGILLGINQSLYPEVKDELTAKGFKNLYCFPAELLDRLHCRDIPLLPTYFYTKEIDRLAKE